MSESSVTSTNPDLSDIRPNDWVDRRLPRAWRPYARLARLDRPTPIWLTLFPCWAAMCQAAGGPRSLQQLAVFSLGAFLMRSAGCTVNDIADRNFDGHVERTRFRPLASGQISLASAILFLCLQLAIASTLLLFLTPHARVTALCVLPLVLVYPFCKRFMHWPQAVLGAAFNWGMLVAWAEIAGHIPAGAILMWAGAVFWQIGYDTIYAYVDVKDDSRLGLKSTAILFASRGKLAVAILYTLTVLAWWSGGSMVGMSNVYGLGVAGIALHLAWQTWQFDPERPVVNYGLFLANILTAALLAAAALMGTW